MGKKMFDEILPRFNVSTTYIDGTKIENFVAATKENTTLYYLETPNSWIMKYRICRLLLILQSQRHNNNSDNSFCTPLYQRPIEYG
jgi:cystathionine beta-lyase/cystathionine gamma-synthase